MATKIRLQRRGRKHYAFYSIVIADSRSPRDGKFTEKIGTYNPNTNPASVDINFERALFWVNNGAIPTDTVRNILSREGVYMMKHLQGGVKKGAFDEAAAQAKFEAWKNSKVNALNSIKTKDEQAKAELKKARFEAEKEANAAIAKKVADKKAAEALAKLRLRLLPLLRMLRQQKQQSPLLRLNSPVVFYSSYNIKAVKKDGFYIYLSFFGFSIFKH